MPRHVAILGGGIAGLTAAYELTRMQREGADLSFTLIEGTDRLGGTVETARQDNYVLEGGPDGWVSEKPWARELAVELGLEDQLISSNDADRVTYILRGGSLIAMPDGMRMMVPTNLQAIEGNVLFSEGARRSYREEPARAAELKAHAPAEDESVASFVERHFGEEVLNVIGAPLLNGVFGGDVHQLSVQAVMKPFVQMEREHGSLILALQRRAEMSGAKVPQPIFTSLRNGVAALTDALSERIPNGSIQRNQRATSLERGGSDWIVHCSSTAHTLSQSPLSHAADLTVRADTLILATPVFEARQLLAGILEDAEHLLNLPSSSALTIAYAFDPSTPLELPKGFGFLAPPEQGVRILAATFSDQKFNDRAPQGGHTLRAYYGGDNADLLAREDADRLALEELETVLGRLPTPVHTRSRYWPRALPQYHVGHLERMAKLDSTLR